MLLNASSHICTASSRRISRSTRSFKQQSQWIILSSICYCMAEGSRTVHTCPATCLHHRARAGRDSVCQCLQWSDYAPVLRHVQSSSVCSLSCAAICICLVGTVATVAVHGQGFACRHVNCSNQRKKAPLIIPHIPG